MDRPRLIVPDSMSRRRALGLGAAAAAALTLPGCSRGRSDEPAPAEPATLATGNKGGVYNRFGSGLASLVSQVTGVQLTPVVTDGSIANLRKVASGQNDVGFTTSDSAYAAYEGLGQFASGPLRFHALGRTYDNYVHVVVPMASKIDSLEKVAGKVVSVGPENSGTKLVADMILAQAGLATSVTKRTLSLEQAVKQLKDKAEGKDGIDVMIWSGGLPTGPIEDLQKTIGFRLVNIGAVAQTIALKQFGGYIVSSIPPKTYGLASAVPTLTIPNYLITRPNLPDSWAWWIVNTLFRRQKDLIGDPNDKASFHPEAGALDPRSAIATMPVPLHPAAERWYRANHI
ncbi:TAXI family TRAP transporter solute-binding subunit [Kribbella sandramycini]|uniref:TAXI family TRAP transporter solute-binding subunit n=1 Tax=Kribbella sandramycini TaxID=60450 RepID=A0A7Y4L3V5_9ACTN|nr:TAXI family TRAP transporter solute-binding subunit [Kribbella sandramycini]MBB6566383.1 TRAP transporter TAXI family solute receptor [Kribbella sandramycini]NOL42957.1 TAXI family TRAP transporter solute-binding subunit [Kribbella sandramycini]